MIWGLSRQWWYWWQTEDMILIYDVDIWCMMSHLRTVLCFNTEFSWGTEASSRLVRSSRRMTIRGGWLTPDWLSNSIWKHHQGNVAIRNKGSSQGFSLEGYFLNTISPPPHFPEEILTCCHWVVMKALESRRMTLEQRDWTAGHCSSILLPASTHLAW